MFSLDAEEVFWKTRIQQYDDERWRDVWRHTVQGELLQAIGRLRPLSNPATVYVATNEPLGNALNITPVYSWELFPDMKNAARRSDFTANAQAYAETAQRIEAEGGKPTNAAICRRLGIAPPNGLLYRDAADWPEIGQSKPGPSATYAPCHA